MSISTTLLNEKQFSRITKRFVSNENIKKDMAIPYLLNNNQIMATNSHTAVLINTDKLNFTYVPTVEDTSTKDKMERLVEYLFNGFNADISLTIGKVSIQDTIRFLKSIKKKDKEHLLAETY